MFKIKENNFSTTNKNPYINPRTDLNSITQSRLKKLAEYNPSKTMTQFETQKKSQNLTKFEDNIRNRNQSPKISANLPLKRNYCKLLNLLNFYFFKLT